MALDSYTSLKATLQSWLARVDVAADADDIIDLFESWANRNLRVPQMEQEAITSAAEYIGLPTNFLQMRDIQWQGNPRVQLQYMSPTQADAYDPTGIAAIPKFYTIVGDQIRLIPAPNAATDIRMDYWQRITALSDNAQSNWLLATFPDSYLYGSLIHANVRFANPEMAASLGGAWQQVMAEIQDAGKKANLGTSLTMRPA